MCKNIDSQMIKRCYAIYAAGSIANKRISAKKKAAYAAFSFYLLFAAIERELLLLRYFESDADGLFWS